MSTLTMLHLLELINCSGQAGMLLHITAGHFHVRIVLAENCRPNAGADWQHAVPVFRTRLTTHNSNLERNVSS
jgi:hypothetical protein